MVIDITNTYLDLFPVVKALAENQGYGLRRIYRVADYDRMLYRNYFVILTNNAEFLHRTDEVVEDLPEYLRRERNIPMWTDDYTNLTRLLR